MDTITQGHALLIGVDKLTQHYVNPDHFNLSNNRNIAGVRKILELTNDYDKNNIKFLGGSNKQVSWDDLTKMLAPFQKQTQKDKLFLTIYLSCHSAKVKTSEGREFKFLCLSDRMVYIKEWENELTKIHKNNTVFVVNDSCYSGKMDFLGSMQVTFDIHYATRYKKIISNKYSNAYKASIFFLNSSSYTDPTTTEHLVNQLASLIPSHAKNLNYIQFTEILKRIVVPIPNWEFGVENNPQNEFFYKHEMFCFKPRKPQTPSTTQTTTELFIIETTENTNTQVHAGITSEHSLYYTDTYTWSFERDSNNSTFRNLIADLIIQDTNILAGVEYIGVVYVNLDHLTGQPMPISTGVKTFIPIRQMKSVNGGTAPSNGLIVLISVDNAGKIIGKKRTQGKVTNKQGGK
jgi:hypothetical protein